MPTNKCSASFSVSDFSAGASTLTAAVKEGDLISGFVMPVSGETAGGSVTITAQYWKGNKPLGDSVPLVITDTTPPGNSLQAPANATSVVTCFAQSTMPMCTYQLSVSDA